MQKKSTRMCKRPVKSPIKANLCSSLPWSSCSLVCSAWQTGGISQGERERERWGGRDRLRGWKSVRWKKGGGVGGEVEKGGAGWYHLNWFHDLRACILSRFLAAPVVVPFPIQRTHRRRSALFFFPPIFSPRGKVFSSRGISQLFHGHPPPPPPSSFSFSYLPHCHNHSATVGFSNQPQFTVFSKRNWDSFLLSLRLFSSMHPSLALSQPAISACVPFTSPIPTSTFPLTPSLSVNDFSFPSHISSYSSSSSSAFFHHSSLSLFFVLAICSLSPPLPPTWVPFDETWIESGGVSVPCSSVPRRGCQGKRQALFTLNIIWHLICCTFCRCDERRRT